MENNWFLIEEIPKSYLMLLAGWAKFLSERFSNEYHGNIETGLMYRNGSLALFFREADWQRAGQSVFRKSLSNPGFLEKASRKNRAFQQRQFRFGKKISQTNLAKLDDKAVVKLYLKFCKNMEEAIAIGWIDMAMEFRNSLFSPYLQKYLDKKAKQKSLKISGPELFSVFSTPDRITMGKREELELLEICEKIIGNGKCLDFFKSNRPAEIDAAINSQFPEMGKMLSMHAEKYGWIFYMYAGPKWQRKDFIESVKLTVLGKNIAKKIESSRKEAGENTWKKAFLLKLLGVDAKHRKLLKISADIVFNKDLRKHAIYFSLSSAEKLFSEAAKRLGLSVEELRALDPHDIENHVSAGKTHWLKHLAQTNLGGVLFLFKDGKREIIRGKRIDAFMKNATKGQKKEAEIIEGSCAYPGMAQGKVKIINLVEEMEKMNDGDILVSHQTNPDIVLAMKKAAAIVTDLGGITCHAAIVSRELKIPCVVGTENASKLLKDNDLVEINAAKGMVRKIAKQKIMKREKVAEKKKNAIVKKAKIDPARASRDILWLSEISKNDVPYVGGKGASLGELYSTAPVPNGFCITAQAYKRANIGVFSKINDLLAGIDIENTAEVELASAKIQEIIAKTRMPPKIEAQIMSSFAKLGAKFVAVRSSATAEDLPEASFAGQQSTFLNVQEKGVLDAVKKCWASLFTARAIYYRQKNGFEHSKVLISAVVQKMIDSRKAGVMFTADPATSDMSKIMIEGNIGLGETVVSGEVTPDTYILGKKNMKLVSKEIAEKPYGLFRGKGGSNARVKNKKIYSQLLGIQEINGLARLAKEIEAHYGAPQDIEWAIDAKEHIFILQARPITTLGKK